MQATAAPCSRGAERPLQSLPPQCSGPWRASSPPWPRPAPARTHIQRTCRARRASSSTRCNKCAAKQPRNRHHPARAPAPLVRGCAASPGPARGMHQHSSNTHPAIPTRHMQARQELRRGRDGARTRQVVASRPLGDARILARVLAQHDLPGARVLPEDAAAVVDDEGRHRHALPPPPASASAAGAPARALLQYCYTPVQLHAGAVHVWRICALRLTPAHAPHPHLQIGRRVRTLE